ncbi:SunT ABC-type bacteriocin/lantibiotic exporters, contain an N-terminal double-glycine peptidase domain [Burkholderiaceae bacterium]
MKTELLASLMRLAQLQGQAVDRVALHSSVSGLDDALLADPHKSLAALVSVLQLPALKWLTDEKLIRHGMPCLIFRDGVGYGLLRGQTAQGEWLTEWFDPKLQKWSEQAVLSLAPLTAVKVQLAKRFEAVNSPVFKVIKDRVYQERKVLIEIVFAGVMINMLALATSLYSMQVYDRVVPTGATQTLLALTLGVMLAMVFELLLKFVKSNLNEKMVDAVDSELARTVYTRFLAVRMDQLPTSVGGLAAQLKGYETVRAFLSSVPAQLLIDLPFVFLYILIVLALGGWISLIPMVFLVVSLTLGLTYRRQLETLTLKANNASNLKTGLLVETVEGAETIKSGQGGWRMLMRWLQTTDDARQSELEMRNVSEHSQHWIANLHQLSYVLMVAAGALSISRGELTMGGLIACTILSGRILGPIGTIPSMLVQWGHSRAALQSLDRIWQLQDDHHGVDQPIVLERIQGAFNFEGVEASYGSNRALSIPKLSIQPGEKVAVLGSVGSGKTTLLRLLSGMYKPQKGSISLDGVDLSMISKPLLAESIGYLQQEGRLFSGSLRDNLVLGLIDPGDQALLATAQLTGLQQAVLAPNPQGLQQVITEGGQGLSGGQKQLTNLTRVFLRKPRIWLLDEPTASLDRNLELTVLKALATTLKPQDTLVLVTHKPELLELVDRLIVVANHQIVLDGPKAQVLQHLQNAAAQQPAGNKS